MGTFSNTEKLAPFHIVVAPPHAFPLRSTDATFDVAYAYDDKRKTINDYLASNPVTGLLILRDARIAFERYQYDRTASHRFYSASMAKTVTALLVGIALGDGKIRSIDEAAETYVPDLRGSAYGATPLRALLQMSFGIRYVEQYNGADDQARLWRAMFAQEGPTVLDVLRSFNDRPWAPGTHFNYAGADTMVLGLVLRAATGQPLAVYLSQKIWQPMGAESDASWLVDRSGQELASCCLNVTLRDYGRLALLMANDGRLNDKQIVPADWIRDMTTVPDDRAHLKPYVASRSYGYGYQTWILPGAERQFALLGVYGQAIYVHLRLKLVMVNTSVRPRPIDPGILETSALKSWQLPRSRARARSWQAQGDVVVDGEDNPMMRALFVLAIYVTPFLIIGIVARRFMKRRMEDADISNVREQAGAQNRKRRISFFGSIRD